MHPRLARVVALFAFLGAVPASAQQQTPVVSVATVRDTITPVIADHLREGVEQAASAGHEAFVVELDTPGGLDTSMREIVQTFLGAEVPVVVYVAPAGARAASAGAIVTMAAHVAAMTPGTTIGAATPVDLQGGEISDKVINDAASYAESIARLRDRNARFAVEAVRQGRSVTAREAERIGVVDLLAPDRDTLLARLDGRTIELSDGRAVTLRTADARIEPYALRGFRQVLQWLADPNIAFLFLSIGTLAIIYELANPGIGAGGIVGAIMIILAMFSLSVLPVNAVGAIFMVLAIALFIGEILTPGVGVFAAGGTVSLVVGGLFLFRGAVDVDLAVLLPVGIVVGGGALLMGRFAWRTRRAPALTGAEGIVGQQGVVRNASGTTGQVFVNGTWWNARSEGEQLSVDEQVRVVGIDGLALIVRPEKKEERHG